MGKSFKAEINSLYTIWEWASNLDVSNFKNKIQGVKCNPLLIVGSGGSLSACHFASKLHQSKGQIAKAITPLELYYSNSIINSCAILLLSSSGRNTDILTSFKSTYTENSKSIIGLTLALNTPLKKLSLKCKIDNIIEYKNPIGKDGFLATNSLIAFFIILHRSYGYEIGKYCFKSYEKQNFATSIFVNRVNKDYTYKLLYGDWSQPVAIDIESKFSEAALGNVLLSDYRNFGHGRHNWLDKRSNNTAIIALITPSDKELAEKTLALLPKEIKILRIETECLNSLGSIDLLIKSYYITLLMGEIQNIDPGRPGVPEFGSKLYHLNYFKLLNKKENSTGRIAAQMKMGNQSYYGLENEVQQQWIKAYSIFKLKLNDQRFKAIVFDYDGTLCNSIDRHVGIDKKMGDKLNSLLENKVKIGISTGRGSSIRKDLRAVVLEKFWDKLTIGYYNGGEIGKLSDDSFPKVNFNKNIFLKNIGDKLETRYTDLIELKYKPKQLTIEFNNNFTNEEIDNLIQFVNLQNNEGLLCLRTDHSIDVIIRPDVSKLNVVEYFKVNDSIETEEILCIGDKGKYPGNDFELLSLPYSLSVDEVSSDQHSCWNIGDPHLKNVDKTMFYLNCLKFYSGYFKINL